MARLKITQIKSRIGATERQCKNLDALGLKRINASVEHDDSVIIKGMIARVKALFRRAELSEPKTQRLFLNAMNAVTWSFIRKKEKFL